VREEKQKEKQKLSRATGRQETGPRGNAQGGKGASTERERGVAKTVVTEMQQTTQGQKKEN